MHKDNDLPLRCRNTSIVDSSGRIVLLRGASLHCKYPKDLPSHSNNKHRFYDHRNASFVGRPFPLEEADEHFELLSRLGLGCLRLLVPWEAIEHEGPGIYDEEYLDYVEALISRMQRWNLRCIIDCHQDLFSRLLGGSGAPGWTVELAGFDLPTLDQALAAHRHCENLSASDPPPSVWPSGLQKLATATMFTLFFGGDDFAPSLKIPAASHACPDFAFPETRDTGTLLGVGFFMRQSMIAAYTKLAQRLSSNPCVIGIEPMNEPHAGYIGLHSFHTWDSNTDLAFCYFPSAIQGMALGSGYPQKIPYYVRSFPEPTRIGRYETVTPKSSVWAPGRNCVWASEDVWHWNALKKAAIVMRETYFQLNPRTRKKVDFYEDHWFPFVKAFGDRMHACNSDWLIFAGAVPNEFAPPWPIASQPRNLVYSPHFYDLHTLFCKTFGNITFNVQALSRGGNPLTSIYLGRQGVNKNYAVQTKNLLARSLPNYFSEIGTTFEANLHPWHEVGQARGRSSRRRHRSTKWYTRQVDALLNAMDSHASGFAFWLYNPENDAQDEYQLGPHGDGWNGEDFCFVYRAKDDRHLRLRCLDTICRPHPVAIAGINPTIRWDMITLDFDLSFDTSPCVNSQETIVHLPSTLYAASNVSIDVSDGHTKYDIETQRLMYFHTNKDDGFRHNLSIRIKNSSEVLRRQRLHQKRWHVHSILSLMIGAIIVILAVLWQSIMAVLPSITKEVKHDRQRSKAF